MRILAVALLAFLAPAPLAAAFLQFGSPAYDALKTAAERAGDKSWIAQRLNKNMPVTEYSAKELANALRLDSRLEPQYVKALNDAFPPETKAVDAEYGKLDSRLQALSDEVSLVGAKLDRFEAGMRDGLLSGRSRPSMLGSMNANIFAAGAFKGPGDYQLAGRGQGGSGIWTEWTLGGDGYNLTFVMMFYKDYIDFTQAHLGFFFDNAILPGIEVVIADENIYPSLSTLIFSGGSGFHDEFNNVNSLGGRKELIKSSPGFGARGGQDIYLRKKGAEGWWPFSDTQFIATQTFGYYFGSYLNDVAANVKLRGLPALWIFERTDPSFSTVWTFSDHADLLAHGVTGATDNSSAQAFALSSQIAGGGTLYLEVATAEWQNSDVEKSYRDYAYLVTLSKSIGKSAVVFDYQHTGPDYFAGTQQEPSGNAASSFFSKDPRPGPNYGKPAWKTPASEPTAPASNSEHAAVGFVLDFGAASAGATIGTNMQIQPSGPWLDSAHRIGWPHDRYKNNNGAHGFEDMGGVPSTYNAAYSPAIATYQGGTLTANWTEFFPGRPGNIERIILTRNGLNDAELRPDSIKYVNFLDLRGNLDFQAMFDLKRPAMMTFSCRVHNTEESFMVPTLGNTSLLMQATAAGTLNVELPGRMQFVTALGYEDWLSNASFRPIEYHTTWLYFAYWKDFPEFLSGFSVGPSGAVMKHEDSNMAWHNYTIWRVGMGASTSF